MDLRIMVNEYTFGTFLPETVLSHSSGNVHGSLVGRFQIFPLSAGLEGQDTNSWHTASTR